MNQNINLDEKNEIVMKLLHYFITEKNYNPIVLQGVENEIWLENMDEDYKVVRIVSSYIHNDEQFDFDKFKTNRILKKIKKKTLTFKVNVLSLFLDLGENVSKEELEYNPNALCIKVTDENDIKENEYIKEIFPDISKKLKFSEQGIELFAKITEDINRHNVNDARRIEKVFRSKVPYVTYIIILINVILFVFGTLTGLQNDLLYRFGVAGELVKNGDYYRLFTAMFFHGGFLHLLFNCYALYIIGSQLEGFLGKIKYLIIYLLSGVAGALFSCAFNHSGISIGASGAIFGLMGSLVYFGYYYRVYLGNVVKSQIIPLIIFNLALGFAMNNIDNFAHIGGLIGGALVTKALGIEDKSKPSEKINGWILTLMFFAFSIYLAIFYKM